MIQVLHRALDILELLSRNMDKEHSLGEIATPLNLNSGTCSNIIKTMMSRGYVEKKKGYLLGRQAYYLTNNFSNEKEIIKVAKGPMKNLSKILKESCVLSVLKNNSRRTLYNKTYVQELQANPGKELNAYQTATGKLLLAYLEPVDRNAFIKTYGLPENWENVKSEQSLISELQKINKLGYAVHYTEANIVGVAMPIFRKGQVIAGLGIYLPENRYTENIKNKIFDNLAETAKTISDKMIF
ncbi:IclR family transcriptional regulator [Sphingobacterium faecale]|uniref:Helix-turn-helix domain-containing protein n=1 Tax=Sphingobacterium faecale TaxID=2803775 RepID=A0ABS1R372_9SPHI|nr:IclR family transcriptional regulator C-terminal domain-containing protein [Sphingobacterium faecale]MBL1408730.1 helix-turn-helix domain-containing protein [Sphingobacterium faecale]